jgi:hypothetical protein
VACTEWLPRRWVVKLSRTGAIYCYCAGLWHCEDFGCAILRAIGLLVFFRVVTFYTASTHLRRTCGGRRMTQMGHEERFPPTRMNVGCGFRKETIAGMRRNGRDAP